MKSILVLLAVVSLLIPNSVKSQSTLTLQKMCAEEAKKFVSDIQVEFACDYHYNRKLDKCFIKIMYLEKGVTVTLTNVLENKLVGHFNSENYNVKPVFCSVGGKNCNSWAEFEALIKPYMEE